MDSIALISMLIQMSLQSPQRADKAPVSSPPRYEERVLVTTSSKNDPDFAIFMNKHAKRTTLIVQISSTYPWSPFPYITTCAFPRVLYANAKGQKIISSFRPWWRNYPSRLAVRRTFASFFLPKLGETVIFPPLGACPLTNADREIASTIQLSRRKYHRVRMNKPD